MDESDLDQPIVSGPGCLLVPALVYLVGFSTSRADTWQQFHPQCVALLKFWSIISQLRAGIHIPKGTQDKSAFWSLPVKHSHHLGASFGCRDHFQSGFPHQITAPDGLNSVDKHRGSVSLIPDRYPWGIDTLQEQVLGDAQFSCKYSPRCSLRMYIYILIVSVNKAKP